MLLGLGAGVLGVPHHSTMARRTGPSGTRRWTVTVWAKVPLAPGEANSLAPEQNQLRNRHGPGALSPMPCKSHALPCWLLPGVHADSLTGLHGEGRRLLWAALRGTTQNMLQGALESENTGAPRGVLDSICSRVPNGDCSSESPRTQNPDSEAPDPTSAAYPPKHTQ